MIPQLHMRHQPCPEGGPVLPNSYHLDETGRHRVRISYIVALPDHSDFTYRKTAWQDNPNFPEGQIHVPSIDILAEENTFIFDGDDPEENYRQALVKMKELWAQAMV
jgi:hypothetical protein